MTEKAAMYANMEAIYAPGTADYTLYMDVIQQIAQKYFFS